MAPNQSSVYNNSTETVTRKVDTQESFIEKFGIDKSDFSIEANKQVDEQRYGSHEAILRKIILTNKEDGFEDTPTIRAGEKVFIKFLILSKRDFENVVVGVSIKNIKGINLWSDNNIHANKPIKLRKGANIVVYSFQANFVADDYLFFAALADISTGDRVELDHRRPNKLMTITGVRMNVGCVFAPIEVKAIGDD